MAIFSVFIIKHSSSQAYIVNHNGRRMGLSKVGITDDLLLITNRFSLLISKIRLKDPFGNPASVSSISERVKDLYESFAVILSRDEPENAHFADPQNVFHIQPDSFSSKIFETIEIIKMKLSDI